MRIVDDLLARLGDDVVAVDPAVVEKYRADRALTAAAGQPVAVVRARSTDDVATALRLASAHGVAVVPRGAGTGLSGGSSALDGAITVSTERMRSIAVDPDAMVAVVQPGALNVEVKQAAAAEGLWYPPDPSSFEICSIGGNLATNAGGLCCVKYGVTTDYVLGIEVVLVDGTVVRLGGRTIKNVAGLDLKRIFVGSEGTLGIITEATLRLRPAPPPRATIVGTFAAVADAGRAVQAVMGRYRPAAVELMDRAAVVAVESVRPMGLDTSMGALLLVQTDAGDAAEDAGIEACLTDCGAGYVARTDDPDEGELLMAARRMAIPCVERLGTVLIEDVGVPIPRIAELLDAVAAIAVDHDVPIPMIGHAGDGNFHPLVTFDPTDPDDGPTGSRARAERAFGAVMDVALGLGGTITGEHGVGSLKARHLDDQLGPDVVALQRRIKHALDPDNLLNPGKWL